MTILKIIAVGMGRDCYCFHGTGVSSKFGVDGTHWCRFMNEGCLHNRGFSAGNVLSGGFSTDCPADIKWLGTMGLHYNPEENNETH